MKNIISTLSLFVIVLAASLQCQAQDITFTYGGQTYGAGDIMHITVPHGIMQEASGISLTNNSGRPNDLKVSCIATNTTSIEVGGICTAGGQCSSSNTSHEFTINGGETYSDFEILLNIADEVPTGHTGTFLLVVFPAGSPEADTTLNPYTFVQFEVNDVAIPTVGRRNHITLYPNPSTDCLHIDIDRPSANAELHIYDMKGTMVYNATLEASQTHSTINTQQLPQGSYFCTLTSEGTITAATKFVVAK